VFCILDIETVLDDRLILDVFSKAPGDNLKICRERFDESLAKREASYGTAAFPPIPYHRPVVAVMLVVDAHGRYITHRALTHDDTIVEDFWGLITQGMATQMFNHLVTFNGLAFDLPVMEFRAMQASLCLPTWFRIGAKPWDDPRNGSSGVHIDLFEQLFPRGAKHKAGLDVVAKMLGLPGKTENGGNVAEMHAAGEIPKITSYCAHDVLNTYGALLRYLKAATCDVEPWADQQTFQHTCKMMSEFNTAAFAARAGSLAVATREKAPF